MKRASWIVCLVLAALIAAQVAVWHSRRESQRRTAFLAMPQSVVLDRNSPPTDPPSQAAELAGLTADDLVRGLLSLVTAENDSITPAQARALLPVVSRMNKQRYRLLTMRNERHAANEASMEDTLAISRALSDKQLQAIVDPLANAAPQAAMDQEWRELLAEVGISRPQ